MDVPLPVAVVDALGGGVAVQGDVGLAQQGADKGRWIEPRAVLPIQPALGDRDACDLAGLAGGDGAVEMLIVRVLRELGVALGFAGVVVKMQHATGAPALLLWQQALQQAAGVAVACEQ